MEQEPRMVNVHCRDVLVQEGAELRCEGEAVGFILTERPLPVGTLLSLSVPGFPARAASACVARVIEARRGRGAAEDHEPGMMVELEAGSLSALLEARRASSESSCGVSGEIVVEGSSLPPREGRPTLQVVEEGAADAGAAVHVVEVEAELPPAGGGLAPGEGEDAAGPTFAESVPAEAVLAEPAFQDPAADHTPSDLAPAGTAGTAGAEVEVEAAGIAEASAAATDSIPGGGSDGNSEPGAEEPEEPEEPEEQDQDGKRRRRGAGRGRKRASKRKK